MRLIHRNRVFGCFLLHHSIAFHTREYLALHLITVIYMFLCTFESRLLSLSFVPLQSVTWRQPKSKLWDIKLPKLIIDCVSLFIYIPFVASVLTNFGTKQKKRVLIGVFLSLLFFRQCTLLPENIIFKSS